MAEVKKFMVEDSWAINLMLRITINQDKDKVVEELETFIKVREAI